MGVRRQHRSLPDGLAQSLPADALASTRIWWAGLPIHEQQHLEGLWQAERLEDDAPGLAVLLDARFVEPTDTERELTREEERGASRSLYEWVVGHDDVPLLFSSPTVHICRAHPESRRLLRRGVIPAQFRCPLARSACPLEKIVAHRPGRAAQLSLAGLVPRSAVGRRTRG